MSPSAALLLLIAAPLCGEVGGETLRVLQFNVWQEGTKVDGGVDKIAAAVVAADADVVAFSEVRNYGGRDWHATILAALRAADPGGTYRGRFVGGDVGLVSRFPILSTATIYDGTGGDGGSIVAYRLAVPGGRAVTVCAAHLDYKRYALNLVRGYHGGAPDWAMIDADGDGEPDRVGDVAAVIDYGRASRRDEAVAAFLAFAAAERAAGRPVVLAGDFNDGSHLDWTDDAKELPSHYGLAVPWPNSRALAAAGFVDAYRTVHPDAVTHPGSTWPAPAAGRGPTTWTPKSDERDRIDYIYASPGLAPRRAWVVGPRACWVGDRQVPDGGADPFLGDDLPWPSDHKAVLVELTLGAG